MIKILAFVIFSVFAVQLFGQERLSVNLNNLYEFRHNEKKVSNQRSSHDWENKLFLQFGTTMGVYSSYGVCSRISFEKNIKDKPISWYADYSLSLAITPGFDEKFIVNQHLRGANDIVFRSHQFGGGLHYFIYHPDRAFLPHPYIGAGGFIGFIQQEINFNFGNDVVDRGFEFGFYGTIGVRWSLKRWQIGQEVRFGIVENDILNKREFSDNYSVVCQASLRF